jgi:glycosyltransferase involved in cell wall biosynthesis
VVPQFRGSVCLIGHPFTPIGMGEHVRRAFRAFRSVGVRPGLIDLYGLSEPDPEAREEFVPYLSTCRGTMNVFCINGDEVKQALSALEGKGALATAYNVVYPMWELSRYPQQWARQLQRFDEVWAPSEFVKLAIESAVRHTTPHMPLSCEFPMYQFLNRRWFGIPEDSYAFLFFFDLRSYVERKNPEGVISAYRKLVAARPFAKTTLVLKVNGEEQDPGKLAALQESIDDLRDRLVLINRTLTNSEAKNLVRCCDSFVSLHRSEGFGLGLAEAMFLGKPVIGTAYSGNMDFMSSVTALLVDYALVRVPAGAYPHWQDQVWAEPDVDQATRHMMKLIDQPALGTEIGKRASLHIRVNFSHRATGVRYVRRLAEIQASRELSHSSDAAHSA